MDKDLLTLASGTDPVDTRSPCFRVLQQTTRSSVEGFSLGSVWIHDKSPILLLTRLPVFSSLSLSLLSLRRPSTLSSPENTFTTVRLLC